MGTLEIANALAASRRAVQLYPPEHPTHREAVRNLIAAVAESVDVRPLIMNVRNGRLYEGSEVVTHASPGSRSLAEALESRRVESLTFHTGFGDADAVGLSEVLSLRPSPDLQVAQELEERSVRAVTVSELEDLSSREAEDRDRRREADRALYRQSITAFNRIAESLSQGLPADPNPARQVIAQLIERVSEDMPAVLALATMSGHGDRSRFHAVGVMLQSLALGSALQLSDRQLVALGLAALVHDIGAIVPGGGDESSIVIEHPARGGHALGGLPEDDCVPIIVAFEHHMAVNGGGWPQRSADYEMHPYSRMVAVADRYDNLIRPAEGAPARPDEAALQLLKEATDGPLDPIFARLFVQLIGVIPVTSVVRLSDETVGLVRSPGTDSLRPLVRVIWQPDGGRLRPPLDLDMAEEERFIVEVVPAGLLGVQPSDYL